MQSLVKIPKDIESPPPALLTAERPARWQGLDVTWTNHDPVAATLIGLVSECPAVDGRVYLLGRRYDTEEALVDGESMGDGFFMEYVVLLRRPAAWQSHRLIQQESVTYTDRDEEDDCVSVSKVKKSGPKWLNKREAAWPTLGGKPMEFVATFEILDTPIARASLGWNLNVHLFVAQDDEGACFKVLEERRGEQSADAHYDSEAARLPDPKKPTRRK